LNNRRANLRVVTPQQSVQNQRGRSSTGHRNVYLENGGRFRVRVCHQGVRHNGGCFDSFEAAVTAAVKLRAELFTHVNEARSWC
jgi:hypothetical protein